MRICGRIHRHPGRAAMVAGLVAVLGLVLAVPPVCGEPSSDAIPPMLRAPSPQTPARASATAGLRIYIDPLTGKITSRPSPEQALELSREIQAFRFEQSTEPGVGNLTRFDLRGGGTGVYVGGRFLTSTVVEMAPDGSFHITCTPHPEQILDADPAHPGHPVAPAAAPLR